MREVLWVLRLLVIPLGILALAKPKEILQEKAGGCQACGGLPATQTKPSDCTLGVGLANCYQPPLQVKCCDQSCPKCVGGIMPKPGGLCRFGCPGGVSCPDTCPCDECVCCFTRTRWLTETSTCLDSTTVQVIQLDTSTEQKYESTVTTETVPITFTVTDIFMFTGLTASTRFATGPTFVTSTSTSIETISSQVYLTVNTIISRASIVTLRASTTATIVTNPVRVSTSFFFSTTVLEVTQSITTVTGFSFDVISVEQTTTVPGTWTFYQFTSVPGVLSVVTGSTPGPLLSTIIYSSVASLTETVDVTVGTTSLFPSVTLTVDFTPTVTRATTTVPFQPPAKTPALLKAPEIFPSQALIDSTTILTTTDPTITTSSSSRTLEKVHFALPFFPE